MSKYLLLLIGFLWFSNTLNAKDIVEIQGNKINASASWTLYFDNNLSHKYEKIDGDKKIIFPKDSFEYTISAFQNISSNSDDMMAGDSLFSKLVIDCYTPSTHRHKMYEFVNDECWSRLDYWNYAPLTNEPWKSKNHSICMVVNLNDYSKAIILRGYRDAIDPEKLTIFVICREQVKLVFHDNYYINYIQQDIDSSLILDLQKLKYDDNDYIIPNLYNMKIGNGKITIDQVY